MVSAANIREISRRLNRAADVMDMNPSDIVLEIGW